MRSGILLVPSGNSFVVRVWSVLGTVNIKFISMKKPVVRLVISNTLAVAYVCTHR